jgi:hypothetical protein
MIPGVRGWYTGTDKEGRMWEIPRHADPKLDGLKLIKNPKQIFDVSDAPDSVNLNEFDRRIEALVPEAVITRIERVIDSAKILATQGLADEPPLDEREWRRGMILSWSHARDLEVVHEAMGHPRLLAGRHDLDEVVRAKHLRKTAEKADEWYRRYVATLDEGAWINVGFFNPHFSASMYKWGDAKGGTQNAMDAHRLAAHHNGSEDAPLDWVEKAVNFVVHHIPREHWGIRHEPRGSFDETEYRLQNDPAIKDSQIGKDIAREVAEFYMMAEEQGLVVPWHLLKVPHDLTPSVIQHAFLVAQAAARSTGVDDEDALSPERIARARSVLARLPEEIDRARSCGRSDLATAYEGFLSHV